MTEITDVLEYYHWNWDLAGEHLGIDPGDLEKEYDKLRDTKPKFPRAPAFAEMQISPEQVQKLQDIIKKYLLDSLPISLEKDMTKEEKQELIDSVITEFGLNYKLTHAPEFEDALDELEAEALTLIRWREQIRYLTTIKECLYNINAKLVSRAKGNSVSTIGSIKAPRIRLTNSLADN